MIFLVCILLTSFWKWAWC